jgi:nucleotide-binding universal stress UspA family protein
MSELVGPICAKWAVENAGEAPGSGREKAFPELAECKTNVSSDLNRPHLVEWTWGKLAPPEQPEGVVLFGAAHAATVTGLARVATLLGHYYKALPMAVRVDIVHDSESREIKGGTELFSLEKAEAEKMGYTLATSLIQSSTISEGILFAAKRHHAKAIVLGHPVEGTAQEFEKVVEQVAKDTNCRIIVTRFFGVLHTERILVPLVRSSDLDAVADVVSSLSGVGNHRITLLQLMPPDTLEEELEEMEVKLREWAKQKKLTPYVYSRAVATEARLETIFEEACHHDLLVMASNRAKGLHRFFFGSLAEWVARECTRPLLMILNPKN